MKLTIEGKTRGGISKGRVTRMLRAPEALEEHIEQIKACMKTGNGGIYDIEIDDGETVMARVDERKIGKREAVVGEFAPA